MLHRGLEGAQSIGSAKVGDKTRLDTLVPAIDAFVEAAERGRDSTINLVAKVGRASRLGERSLGV